MVAREEFEPVIFQSQGTEPTNEPPRLTIISSLLFQQSANNYYYGRVGLIICGRFQV